MLSPQCTTWDLSGLMDIYQAQRPTVSLKGFHNSSVLNYLKEYAT